MSMRLVLSGLTGAALLLAQDRAAAQQPSPAASQPFSLTQVMSAPFASDLVASPDGMRVAWVGALEGRRNIYVAEAPQWVARQVTRYDADDGQELLSPAWTPDGGSLVYVRGGDRSAAGEYPNPASDPRGAVQAVWLVPASGGPPRRLGEGSAPAVSPDGDRVAFVLRDTVWVAPLRTPGPARILFRARGRAGSPVWSPDGERLAFVSRRGTHSFVGVYEVASDAVRYPAPSVDRDDLPRWSLDGSRLAFVRQYGQAMGGLGAQGNPPPLPPWSILVVEVLNGTLREVWRAPAAPEGSFPSAAGDWALAWSADERLVFAAELGGWLGLYAVASQGGEAVRLTPQDCEVEGAVMERQRRSVLYTSNCGDLESRHVTRVAVESGARQVLTGGPSFNWSPQPLAEGGVAFLRSDAVLAGAPFVLRELGGVAQRVGGFEPPAAFPSLLLVEPQTVATWTADTVNVRMQLFLPPGGAPGRRPAVIFFHGGPRRQMLPGWHYMYYYHNSYAFNQYLASRGFVVLSVNFRGGIGYGRAFRTAPGTGMNGASEYTDVLAAAAWLRARPDVDSTRIALWGGSYGGYLTALGLARNSDLFAAGVDLHGVHDWSASRPPQAGTAGPAAADSLLARRRAASPIGHVARWRSPVLFIHGDDDRNVAFAQTVELAQVLRRLGVPVQQLVFPDEVHDFLRHEHWLEAYRAAADFLAAQLRPAGN